MAQLGTTQSALSEQAQSHILGFQRESQEAKYRAQLIENKLKEREVEFEARMENMKRALFQKEEELKRSKLLPGTEPVTGKPVGGTSFPTLVRPAGVRNVSPVGSLPTAPGAASSPPVVSSSQVPGLSGKAVAGAAPSVSSVNFLSSSKHHVPGLPMITENVSLNQTVASGTGPSVSGGAGGCSSVPIVTSPSDRPTGVGLNMSPGNGMGSWQS